MSDSDYMLKAIDAAFTGNFDAAFSRGVKREAVTHYIWWDTPGAGSRGPIRAACGALVYQTDHANEPTCEQCRRELTRFEAQALDGDTPF